MDERHRQGKQSTVSGLLITTFLVLAGAGGSASYLYYQHEQEQSRLEQQRLEKAAKAKKAKQEAARKAAARKAAAEEARRKAEEAEAARLAAQKAEEERAAREKEETERKAAEEAAAEEAQRRAEEEEAARRKAAEDEKEQEEAPEEEAPPATGPYAQKLSLKDCVNSAQERQKYESSISHLLKERDFADFAAAFRPRIGACMEEIITGSKLAYPAYKRNSSLMQAVELCMLIEMAGPQKLEEFFRQSSRGENINGPDAGSRFFDWMLHDKARPLHLFIQSFVANEAAPENMGYAIGKLFELWDRTPKQDRAKYLKLAVACSLLHPSFEQNRGSIRSTKEPLLSICEIYDYYREMDSKKKLVTDIKSLSVPDLLYVVDTRLPRSEYDWVLKNLHYKQAQWGEAYGSVKYLMERATQNSDPYKIYSFGEILRVGGVCRDQAYYAANTAKCAGIPAVYIVGDGDRGPHAWIASLVDKATWKQTGSYGYNSGSFTNPCSLHRQHESSLLRQDKKSTADKLAPAYDAMALSQYLVYAGFPGPAQGTAKYVSSTFRQLTASWANLMVVQAQDKAVANNAEEWRKLYNELMREGRRNPELIDLGSIVLNEHLLKGKSKSAQRNELERSLRSLKQAVGDTRGDLVLEGTKRLASFYKEEENQKGISSLYKKALKENSSRGDIFQQLLAQYASFLEEDDSAAWNSLAKDAEAIFNKSVKSNNGDYFKMTKEVEIQKAIGEAYIKAGNSKKGEKLIEEAEARLAKGKNQNS